tara:strand:- start:263 stop:436 length:174 start_codon:yes stop_codon:yes gene_type:complete
MYNTGFCHCSAAPHAGAPDPQKTMLSTLSSSFAFSGPSNNVEYLAEFVKVREATLQA